MVGVFSVWEYVKDDLGGWGLLSFLFLVLLAAVLVCGGRIRRDKKNGGSGGVGASSSADTKSSGCSGSWNVHWQSRKDPQMEYSKIGLRREEKSRLQVSLLELDRFEILLDEWEEGQRSAFLTNGKRFPRIPTDCSQWSGSISPEGFLSFVLLWLVIIVAVVGVTIVVVIIVAVVVVVESSSVVKLSFVIT
ncbi:hypothetical protein Tco_1246502 [Tanacetum coccineum]